MKTMRQLRISDMLTRYDERAVQQLIGQFATEGFSPSLEERRELCKHARLWPDEQQVKLTHTIVGRLRTLRDNQYLLHKERTRIDSVTLAPGNKIELRFITTETKGFASYPSVARRFSKVYERHFIRWGYPDTDGIGFIAGPLFDFVWQQMNMVAAHHNRGQLLLGLHPRVGKESSVQRFKQHALSERLVLGIVMQMLGIPK